MELHTQIQEFLERHGASSELQSILDSLKRKVPVANVPCPSGNLFLIQFLHPVAQRQEIFLGNVLFNAYLGLTMQRAMLNVEGTDSIPLVHDVESYYMLVHTPHPLTYIREQIRQAWIDGMEELYFSEPAQGEMEEAAHRGYFGRFSNMLANYYKSNIQPFPLMIVPLTYAELLEKRIRNYLLDKLRTGVWTQEVANFTANFSYFYGQTSGGTGDVQSSPNFLRRLVAEYEVISPDDMISAFQLSKDADFNDAAIKTQIQEKLFKKGETPAFYIEKLQQVFEQALQHFGDSIEKQASEKGEPSEWLFRYHREKGVFLDLTPEQLMDELTLGATVAGKTLSQASPACSNESCIMCGYREARLSGATIISTDSFSKFHNHTINRGSNEKRICYNCALYAYLTIKLSGSKSGGMGQVPRNGNVVFHYGSYTDQEVRELADHFVESMLYLTNSKGSKFEADEDLAFLFEDDEEKAQQNAKILRSLLLRNDNGEIHLFPIKFGERRLILFLLPGLQDNIQKRLSASRYSTMNILSFLYRLGRLFERREGSFYYLTLPKSEDTLLQKPRLYIKDRVYNADKQVQVNDYYKKVVPALAASRAKSGYEHQIIVAERVQQDPLGVFSHELRGWLADGRASAERQAHFYNLYTVLREIERDEVDQEMVTEVLGQKLTNAEVRGILEEFTDRMFHTLDMLNLLPISLSDRPHSFEKWARDLIAPLKRRESELDEVFEKWQNRVLRQQSFYPNVEKNKFTLSDEVRHRRLDYLQEFKTWCFDPKHPERKELIKQNVNQLLVSLMARAVAYLYPVTELSRQYTWLHVGEKEFFTKEVIEERFEQEIKETSRFRELMEKGHLNEQKHLPWAMAHLVMFSNYYEKFKPREEANGGEAK